MAMLVYAASLPFGICVTGMSGRLPAPWDRVGLFTGIAIISLGAAQLLFGWLPMR